jgi:hypothetical protein
LIGGGAGSLVEKCARYPKKLIIAIEGSGGIADQTKGTYPNERRKVMILFERDPGKAVARTPELAGRRTKPELTRASAFSRT